MLPEPRARDYPEETTQASVESWRQRGDAAAARDTIQVQREREKYTDFSLPPALHTPNSLPAEPNWELADMRPENVRLEGQVL